MHFIVWQTDVVDVVPPRSLQLKATQFVGERTELRVGKGGIADMSEKGVAELFLSFIFPQNKRGKKISIFIYLFSAHPFFFFFFLQLGVRHGKDPTPLLPLVRIIRTSAI